MKLYLSYISIICALLCPKLSQAASMPCSPTFDLECVVNELKSLYNQLDENSADETRYVGGAARSLFLGYAALGKFNKSEDYFAPATKYANMSSAWGDTWPTGEVIEQMIHYGKHDYVIKYLNEPGNLQQCNAAIQLLSFQEEYSLLFRVLDQSDCSVSNVNSICYHIEDQQAFELFKRLNKYYQNEPRESDKYKIYQYSALHCFYSLSNKYSRKRKALSYSGVVKMLNDAEIFIDDKLREHLIKTLIKDNSLDIAQNELKLIEDISIRNEVAETIIWSLVNQNDKSAVRLYRSYLSNIKEANVREEWLQEKQKSKLSNHNTISITPPSFSVFSLQKKLEPISPRNLTVRADIKSSTEVKFLIIHEMSTPEIKLQLLVDFLSNIILRGEGNKTEFIHLKNICNGYNYKQCVFSEITKAYKATKSIFRLNFNNPVIENEYIEANAMMANYAFLQTKAKKNKILPASWVVARYNEDCSQYLEQYIQEFSNKNEITLDIIDEKSEIAIECLITNFKYKNHLHKSTSIKSVITKRLIDRLHFKPQHTYAYLKALAYNLPKDDAHKLIGEVLNILKYDYAEITTTDQKTILDYIRAFLEAGSNYDYARMSQLYKAYNRADFNNEAIDMLDKNILFKQRRANWHRTKIYRREFKDFEKAFNKEDEKMKSLWLAIEIYDKIQNSKQFRPSYPAQEKMYVREQK